MLELILEHVDDVQGFVDREEFVKPIPLGHAEVLLVTEQEVAAALDVTTSGLGLLLRLVKPHSVDDLTTVPGDDMEAVVDEGRVRTHLLQGVAVGTRHVEREGLDRSELVVRELTEEALDGLLAPVLTHPDEAPGFEVEDRGHVAVALVDTNLVDRQEPEPIVARGADFAEQAPLVYLLDGVPGQAEVLGHLFDGQIPTQVLDSLLEAARRSSERVEEHVGLDSNAAIGAPHFTMRNVEIHSRLGQARVAHPADVIAVDRFDSLPAARASRPRGLVRGERDQTVALQADYVDTLSGIEAIREYGVGRRAARRHLDLFDAHQAELEDLGLVTARIQSILDTLASVLFLAVLILGGVGVIDGVLSIGQMLAAYSLTGMALPSLQRVIGAVFTLQNASAAADRIQDILLSEPEDPQAGRTLERVNQLEVRRGSFRWRGALPQIDGLDFVLRRGEIVGLTGPNGSGKSTLIGVLTRRYALTSGTFLVNGEDARGTKLADFRRLVQVVPESVPLFKGSLGQNLFLGVGSEDHADAVSALDHEGMRRFLARFPTGLATPVGEGGRQLSAGERQIVGLLRALVTSPDVLILDEALSSLDVELRWLAIELIRRHAEEGSVLIVSHHQEVLAVAHEVFVLTHDGIEPSRVREHACA